MATLTAWKLSTPEDAGEAPARLEKLRRDTLIQLHDAAVAGTGAFGLED